MDSLTDFLPTQINTGCWFTGYSLDELKKRVGKEKVVLPICSLGTPAERLAELGPLILPPLFHEALNDDLKTALLDRIRYCFPYYEGTRDRENYQGEFEIVELSVEKHEPPAAPKVLAFSVDTAVEEHGPHLPLATDTIQSYAVLQKLADEFDGFLVGPPVDYGHLTWGLPFGLSIDITPPLVTEYVCGFVNAMLEWMSPERLYVVDVHGSIVHRTAIQDGLKQSQSEQWAFRWLHEPLVEFAGERGDQHAGGVETALVEHIDVDLVDRSWWPDRVDEVEAKQMTLEQAVELSSDLSKFIGEVESRELNGIVGEIRNYFDLDQADLMGRMLAVAREDVRRLLELP